MRMKMCLVMQSIYVNDTSCIVCESVLEVVTKGSVIALFSPSNSLELLYICKVLDYGVATEDCIDENNYHIEKNSPYVLVTYYEKKPYSEF